MRFLTPDEVPIKNLTVYRAFPLSSGIMLLLLTPAIPLLATTGSTNGVLWYVVCILTLLWLLAANDLRKAFKPTSWLITSLRAIKRSWQRQDNGEISRSLDLTLRHGISIAALAKHLADERSGRPGGVPVKKSKWGHFPVSLEPGAVLRVQWRAWPSRAHCIRCLNSHGISGTAAQSVYTPPSSEELPRSSNLFALIENLRSQDPSLTLTQATDKAKSLIAQSSSASHILGA